MNVRTLKSNYEESENDCDIVYVKEYFVEP
jgi:hypothetical protein